MNKDILEKIIKEKFQNNSTRELFLKHMNCFFEYDENNNRKYEKGEEVLLTENSLIHGSRIDPQKVSLIKENGLIASEFFSAENVLKKKPYIVEFWNVEKNMPLKEFIDVRAGVTIEIIDVDGKTRKYILSSIEDISKNLLEIKKYREFTIYQNQEQRFVPNDYCNNSTMAFIINNDTDKKNEIIKNDIFREKYIDGEFDIHETGREKGIILGVPAGLIEGILVCDKIKENKDTIDHIHEVFSNSYICDTKGKVIIGNA